jgi:hypothetical protein
MAKPKFKKGDRVVVMGQAGKVVDPDTHIPNDVDRSGEPMRRVLVDLDDSTGEAMPYEGNVERER